MDPNLVVSIASLAVSIVTSVFAGYIAFVGLKLTAKPKLRILLRLPSGSLNLQTTQAIFLTFEVQNIGHWYAKPAATHLRLYFNFDPAFQPLEIRFGSSFQRTDGTVNIGKGGMKYLLATGIRATHGEPSEEVVTNVQTPDVPGVYKGWVTAYSAEGDCGIHPFQMSVT